jgi:hypothetical protein
MEHVASGSCGLVTRCGLSSAQDSSPEYGFEYWATPRVFERPSKTSRPSRVSVARFTRQFCGTCQPLTLSPDWKRSISSGSSSAMRANSGSLPSATTPVAKLHRSRISCCIE